MNKRLSAALLALLSMSSAHGQYSNKIIDADSHEPIPFASVFLIDYQIGVVTDSIGVFNFSNQLPEEFKLRVSSSGYETKILMITSFNKDSIISLEPIHIEFDEVTVSTPRGGLQTKNATHVESRKLDELNEVPAISMGELLQKIPGVYSTSSGPGISKPVVRGFQGVRVVSMLNGVRLENQQWGGDHDFGITDLAIGSVEVIKGPSSLLYGADALGGVIYFADENYVRQNHYELKFGSTFTSNTMGTKNNLLFKFSKNNIRLNIAGNYTNHADYQLPDGRYVENSRFNGYAGKFALGANKKHWVTHLRYSYAKSAVGIIGAHDEEEEPGGGEEHEDEFKIETQPRGITVPFQGYENHLASWENKFFKGQNEWRVLLGHSYNKLAEFEDSEDSPAMALVLNNTSYSVRYKRKLSTPLELIAGIQGAYQTSVNRGEEEQLIPNSRQIDNGIFAILYFTKNKWSLQGGLRYDLRLLDSEETTDSITAFSGQFGSYNFSLGTVRSSKKNTFRVNASSGFRVPHLSELLADGEHQGALRYEVGNRDLKSERAFQIDLADEIHGEHLELVMNPFASFIQNYIYLQETDSIIGELSVFEYQQLSSAFVVGLDLGAHYHPHFAHWLHWEPSFSFIYGQDQNGGAIPFMPQARIMNNVKVNFGMDSKFKVENVVVQHAYYFNQDRVSGLETVSKGYNVLDLGVNLKYDGAVPITFSFGAKNLFNERYIDHLSRLKNLSLNNAGINFYARLKIELLGKFKE